MVPPDDGVPAGDAFEAALTALRARARTANTQRIEVVEAALTAARDGRLDDDQRLGAELAAHSLVGSAETFGYAQATTYARTTEEILGQDGLTAQAVTDGLAAVAELRVLLATGPHDTQPPSTETDEHGSEPQP